MNLFYSLKVKISVIRTELIILAAFFLLTLLLGILNYFLAPKAIEMKSAEYEESIYPALLDSTQGYDVKNSSYVPFNDDPNINITGPDYEIQCVKVIFAEPIEHEFSATLYYSNDFYELSQSNSVTQIISEGQKELNWVLPKANYDFLRFDLDGEFKLDTIYAYGDVTFTQINNYDAFLMIVIIDVFIFLVWLLVIKFGYMKKIKSWLKDKWVSVKNNPKKAICSLVIVILILFASFVLEFMISRLIERHTVINSFRWRYILAAGLIVFSIIKLRGKVESMFLALSLIIGLLFASSLPISLVSWDEETHYSLVKEQSFAYTVTTTPAESDIRSIPIEEYYSLETRESRLNQKNEFYRWGNKEQKNRMLITYNYNKIAYMPSAFMLFTGRSLGMSFSKLFIFGRFGNVLLYSFIIYFALKKLKTGKYIMSALALIPTSVFLSANYGYDYWVIAFLMYGTAYFLSELQQPDKPVTWKDCVLMIGAFVIGLGPKAVYFPVMFMLYFIGKKKFTSASADKKYRLAVSLSILFVILSFVLPFVISDGSGDIRGGSEVNAFGQVKFILGNPLAYTKILLSFLKDYLSLENTADYTVFFAYLGHIGNQVLFLMTLAVVTFTDKNIYDGKTSGLKYKGVMAILCLVCIVLASTALYVAYTPVALGTILGCQPRYILPVLFPVLSVIGSNKIQNKMDPSVYSVIIFSVLSYVLMSGIWNVCISHYSF